MKKVLHYSVFYVFNILRGVVKSKRGVKVFESHKHGNMANVCRVKRAAEKEGGDLCAALLGPFLFPIHF